MGIHHVSNDPAQFQPSQPVGWGAAIIDEKGNEVPITEAMIQRACNELARSWTFPRMEGSSAAC